MVLLLTLVGAALAGLCDGHIGFYCLDRQSFVWCYRPSDDGYNMTCSDGTVCKCGKTVYNPCVFSFQELKDCEGNPGDILKDRVK